MKMDKRLSALGGFTARGCAPRPHWGSAWGPRYR